MSNQPNENATGPQDWLDSLQVVIKDSFSPYQQTLSGFQAILEFFESEQTYWESILSRVKPNVQHDSRIQGHATYFKSCVTQLKTFVAEAPNFKPQKAFEQKWNNIAGMFSSPKSFRGDLDTFYSKSPIGSFVANLFLEHPQLGDGAMKYFRREGVQVGRPHELNGYLRAALLEHPKDDYAKQLKDGLEGTRSLWEQKTRDLQQEFHHTKSEFKAWKADFIASHASWQEQVKADLSNFFSSKKDEFATLGQSYEALLKLEAPVRYWKARAKSYRARGWFWVFGLVGISLITIEILAFLLYNMPPAFHKKILLGEPEAIKGLILFATMISFLAYLARVFSRMIFSSFHIERDAEEREQLTYVYLALIKTGAITERERDVVLQSLFSRVETGLLGVDSSPTMPTINEVFDSVVRKKT